MRFTLAFLFVLFAAVAYAAAPPQAPPVDVGCICGDTCQCKPGDCPAKCPLAFPVPPPAPPCGPNGCPITRSAMSALPPNVGILDFAQVAAFRAALPEARRSGLFARVGETVQTIRQNIQDRRANRQAARGR